MFVQVEAGLFTKVGLGKTDFLINWRIMKVKSGHASLDITFKYLWKQIRYVLMACRAKKGDGYRET